MTRPVFSPLSETDSKLIRRIVGRLYNRYTPAGGSERTPTREDFFHYGVIGLLEAQRNFSADLGAKWETFAAYRIEGAIIDSLRKAPLIRLPQEAQNRVRALKEATAEMESENGSVSAEDLAEKLGWSVDEVEKTRILQPTLLTAVDDNSHCDSDYTRNETVLVEKSAESDPQANLIRREITEKLEHCLQELPETGDRIIVKARKLEDITLRELADSFNCSIESVRKREKTALMLLKKCMQRHDIDRSY